MRQARTLIAVVAGAAAALLSLALVALPAAAAGTRHARPAVSVRIVTGSQRTVVRRRAVRVRVRTRRHAVVRLTGGVAGHRRLLRPRVVRSGRHTVRRVWLHLKKAGRRRAGRCGRVWIRVRGTARRAGRHRRRWYASSSAWRRLRSDRRRCPSSPEPPGSPRPPVHPVPSTIDLATANRCDFITEGSGPRTECLFPYPNDYFTRPDASSGTGRRLDLKAASMPANASGKHIDPADINTSDGFSPGAPIVTQVPGLDTPAAFRRTGIVSIARKADYEDHDQPVVLIDAATGQRQPIWAELDALASSPAQTDLEIHTDRNLLEGHRYVVALRDLRRADGSVIAAPDGFRLYRDRLVTANATIEARRAHFESLFATLGAAGIARGDLYMAWDFTVASERNLTERMLAIRNDAFKQLGDTDLADGVAQGHAPGFTVTSVEDFPLSPVPASGQGVQNIRTVDGTFQVPCYLDTAGVLNPNPVNEHDYPNGCPSGSRFKLGPDGLPVRTPGAMMTARFTCDIPRSSVTDDGSGNPVVAPGKVARPSLYGHGLFGDYTEANTTNVRQLGTENGVMVCGTDFSGMAEDDVVPTAVTALTDMSNFEPIPDRLQQGFLNFLYLGRLLRTADGFASDPAFRFGGQPVFDHDQLYYYGNSQGGIAGGALTAVAPDFTRSVLYVPGMRYSELLPRSVDFAEYATILYPSYPVERTRPLLLSLIQSQWDRGEPDGYALHMTDDPLPGTPAHEVLIDMAYGDHQVANVTTEAEARTIGARLRRPAVDNDRLQPGMRDPWFRMGELGDLTALPGGDDRVAAEGSGMFVWDIGPKRDEGGVTFGTDPAPLSNTAPTTGDAPGEYGVDPHDTVIRSSPLIRKQIADFLRVDGRITNPCDEHPCYAAGYKGMP